MFKATLCSCTALMLMLAIPRYALPADAQRGCALPPGVQYTVGIPELPMTSLFPVTVLVAQERPAVARQFSQVRVAEILGSPAIAAGRFPELTQLNLLNQNASITVDRRLLRELRTYSHVSDIRAVSFGNQLQVLSPSVGTMRVIGEENSKDDLDLRFNDTPRTFSNSELSRQSQGTCASALFDEFKAAAEVLVPVIGANDYHEIPMRLANARRLPVKADDRHFTAIQKFETAYRNLIKGCTSPKIDPRISRVVGRLTVGNSVCTALRIAPSHIVTNRHCLFTESGAPIPGVSAVNVRVEFQHQAQNPAPVCGVVQTPHSQLYTEINPNNDFIILRIGARDESLEPVGVLSPAEIREGIDNPTELELVSVWPGSGALNLSSGLDMVTYTGGYCFVVKKGGGDDGGCFLHKCGSLPGGSGAPAFARETGSSLPGKPLRIAGLHRGDASDKGNSSPCRENLPGVRSNNAATILPREILNALR